MQVIVIGAGIIGVSVAEELAIRGASVTVLDMRGPGRGASWASAGLLAPYTEADRESPLLDMCVRSLALFDRFISRARERSGCQIEYARKGTLEVAFTNEEATHLSSTHQWLSQSGIASNWLDAPELRRFEPAVSPAAIGALHIETHGLVGVESLVTALTHSARAGGVCFEAPVEVIDVKTGARDRGEISVSTADRNYRADHVVIAAGSWSPRVRVKPYAPPPVKPIRGQLLRLRWPHDRPPSLPVWTRGCYTVPWPDRTVLVGATVEDVGFDESATAAGIQSLTAAAIQALPEAAAATFIDVRAGLRPASGDGLPFIGALPGESRITYATGHFRNGILLAPLTAALVADAILDGRLDSVAKWTYLEGRVTS